VAGIFENQGMKDGKSLPAVRKGHPRAPEKGIIEK